MRINFDLDGTLANFYGVVGWLDYLIAEDTTPYAIAKPLINLSLLARHLNRLQRAGHELGIISWGSKEASADFDEAVKQTKCEWLAKHLPSVRWDFIHVVHYGTSKWETCGQTGILFDDEARNRNAWENGQGYAPEQIFDILTSLT